MNIERIEKILSKTPLFYAPCEIKKDDTIECELHPLYPNGPTRYIVTRVLRDGKTIWPISYEHLSLPRDNS